MIGGSGPEIGVELTTGPWGADEGGRQLADRSPVEQQASLTSVMTIALGFNVKFRCRVVGRLYLRLRLGAARDEWLHSCPKR